MRILFLSQRVPYPPNRGDKITTWRLIERMRRAHEVTCVAFAHDDGDVAAALQLCERGIGTIPIRIDLGRAKAMALPLLMTSKPMTLGVYGSGILQREVDRSRVLVDAHRPFLGESPLNSDFGRSSDAVWPNNGARLVIDDTQRCIEAALARMGVGHATPPNENRSAADDRDEVSFVRELPRQPPPERTRERSQVLDITPDDIPF